MTIHFTYSRDSKGIELVFDESIQKLFVSARKICDLFSKNQEAQGLAWKVDPNILSEWRAALKMLELLATPESNSAFLVPYESHCALKLLSVAAINCELRPEECLLLVRLFSIFTPCIIAHRPLPPLCEIADEDQFIESTVSLYEQISAVNAPLPIPVANAIAMWNELSPFTNTHPEVARLIADLEQNTRGVRRAFTILEERL